MQPEKLFAACESQDLHDEADLNSWRPLGSPAAWESPPCHAWFMWTIHCRLLYCNFNAEGDVLLDFECWLQLRVTFDDGPCTSFVGVTASVGLCGISKNSPACSAEICGVLKSLKSCGLKMEMVV